MLENRLIKRYRPAGNKRLKRTDRHVYLRCRLDIPYPVLDVAASRPEGQAVNIGPLGSRTLAGELADQLTSLYRLRHCGRRLRGRASTPPPTGKWAAASRLPRRSRPERLPSRLDSALALFEAPDGGARLLAEVDRQMRAAADERRYERAAALCRRRERLAWVLERLEGVLRATYSSPRLVLARHPVKERFDAFWIVQGRLLDWGPLPAQSGLVERTQAACARRRGREPVPSTRSTRCASWRSWMPTTSRRSCRWRLRPAASGSRLSCASRPIRSRPAAGPGRWRSMPAAVSRIDAGVLDLAASMAPTAARAPPARRPRSRSASGFRRRTVSSSNLRTDRARPRRGRRGRTSCPSASISVIDPVTLYGPFSPMP